MNSNYQHTVRKFYQLLEQKDLANWINLWAANAETLFPYANHLMDEKLQGIVAIKKFWSVSPQLFARLSLSIKDIYISTYKTIVFFENNHLIKDTQDYYHDQSIGVFEFDQQGKIKCYTEYFDPINFGQTLQMIQVTQLN